MPSIYTKYKDTLAPYINSKRPEGPQKPSDQVVVISEEDKRALALSPGGRVLAGVVNGTFAEYYQSFIDVYTDGQFRWVGSQGTSFVRVMEALDGDRTSGECAILASAFWALWACPKPFGFGKSGVEFISFDNNDSTNGFVSYHPPGGIRGLGPNILHPFGEQGDTRNCLYNWGNHKIIKYNGIYYDPTYRNTYITTDEMVAFAYTGKIQNINGELVSEIRVVTPKLSRGWRTGQLMYLVSTMKGLFGPYRAVSGWK